MLVFTNEKHIKLTLTYKLLILMVWVWVVRATYILETDQVLTKFWYAGSVLKNIDNTCTVQIFVEAI